MVDKKEFSSSQSMAKHRMEDKRSKPERKNRNFHPPPSTKIRKETSAKENFLISIPSRIQTQKKENSILDPHSHSTSQTQKHLPQKRLNKKIPWKISPQNRLRKTSLENQQKTLKPTKNVARRICTQQ